MMIAVYATVFLGLSLPTVVPIRLPQAGQTALVQQRKEMALQQFRSFKVASPSALDEEHIAEIHERFNELEALLIHTQKLAQPKVEEIRQGKNQKISDFNLETDLMPNRVQRFFSGFSVNVEIADTPNEVVKGDKILPNPQADLRKFSGSLDLQNLFLTSADLKDAYTKLKDIKSNFKLNLTDPLGHLKSREKLFKHFRRHRKRDLIYRTLSAFQLSIASSDRVQTVVDPEDNDPPLLDGTEDDTAETVAVKFLPSRLFSASDRADAYQAYTAYAAHFPEKIAKESAEKWLPPGEEDCIEMRACSSKSHNKKATFLKALLPTFEFKTVDQFDFIQAGGLPRVEAEKKIETYVFTWDLGPIFDVFGPRASSIVIAKQQKEIETLRKEWNNGAPVVSPIRLFGAKGEIEENVVRLVPGSRFRLPLRTTKAFKGLTWCRIDADPSTGNPGKCRELPQQTAISTMSFSGGVLEGIVADSPGVEVVFQARDRFDRIGVAKIRFVVKSTHIERLISSLLRDYIAISLDHRVLLDDDRFETLQEKWRRLYSMSARTP